MKELFPPILVSVGAVLPMLVASPPFKVADNARTLLSSIMVLAIWMGYWLALSWGTQVFNMPLVPIGFVVIAAAVFAFIFRIAQQTPQPKMVQIGTGRSDAAGNPIIEKRQATDASGALLFTAQIDRPVFLWLYLGGMVALAIAAALYVAPADWVLVKFELPKETNGFSPKISKVVLDATEQKTAEVPFHIPLVGEPYVTMQKADYAATTKFDLHISMKAKLDGNNALEKKIEGLPEDFTYFAERINAEQRWYPSLGQHVVIGVHR